MTFWLKCRKISFLAVLEETANRLQNSQVSLQKCAKGRLTKGYIEGTLQLICDYWRTFKTTHQELIKCTTKENRSEISYFANEEYFVVEELYLRLYGDLKDMLASLSPVKMETNTTTTSEAQSQVRLPRIELPKFYGDYEEWQTFHDLFTSLVHDNTTLSQVQKLQYLKSSVGGEAANMLKHINVTDANYHQAWSKLNKRFGNRKVIVSNIVQRLFGQKKVSTPTVNQIKGLLDTTNECLYGLRNLNIPTDSWDPILIFLIVQKLDPDTLKEWDDAYNPDSDILPTWQEMKTFLEAKFNKLQLRTATTSTVRETKAVKEKSYHTTSPPPTKTCIMCSENHTLCHCKEFGKLQPSERSEFVKDKNLCFNCLLPGHSALKCRLQMTCRICKRRHHSLLHEKGLDQGNNTQAHYSQVEDIDGNPSDEDQTEDAAITSHFVANNRTALLATAMIPVRDENGPIRMLRALIDQGSQANFISERAAQLLRVKRTPVKGIITGVGSTQTSVDHVIQLELLSRHDKRFKLKVKAYVMNTRLTTQLPTNQIPNAMHRWPHLENIPLADPNFHRPGRIDMLLGVEVYAHILKNEMIKGQPGSPCAQNTSFGWILFGNLNTNSSSENIIVMHHHVDLDDMLQTLWEIDIDRHKKMTRDEEKCETIFKENYTRNEEGRYIVKLPFKEENPKCTEGNTKEIALKRFKQLEKRFERNEDLKTEYTKVMQEYTDLNHMEEVPVDKIDNPAVYLPHHAVVRESSDTTKVRTVFNASSKGTNNVSLNDELLVGHQLQEDLRSLVMRWRLHRICFVADIIKMYRQILVYQSDADYQRLLWRKNPDDPIKDYRLLRVTFGTACAPYLAVRTLQQVAEDEGRDHPIAAATIKTDFFMDDLMSGQDTVEDAIKVAKQITKILKSGGFMLQKWASNNAEFLREFPPEDRSSHVTIDLKLDGIVRTLGLTWNMGEDTLKYSLNLPTPSKHTTKRIILAEIQRLFDSLGWLTPALVPGKIIIQKLWLKKLHWDEEVEPEIKEEWLDIRKGLEHLKDIQLERWLGTTKDNMEDVTIHGFCDASTKAYGAVAYLRSRDGDGTYRTNIVAAKSRVAPVKPVSLPRLELCGAVLLSKLLLQISEATRIPTNQMVAWTDSTIVLAWLHGDPGKWQTFVRNRIVTILENVGKIWYHVASEDNPADLASRGMLLEDLKGKELWWTGPSWLKQKEIDLKVLNNITTNLEVRKTENIEANLKIDETKDRELTSSFGKFDTLTELLKTIAYCRRFINHKKENIDQDKSISTEELNTALQRCIKIVQGEEFESEIQNIQENKNIDRKSTIKGLNPYLDGENILRVGGRLRHAAIAETMKHPIILGTKNDLVKLIIADAHKRTLHGGVQLMLTYIRSRYWIIRVKTLVTSHIHKCLVCARQRANTRSQIMGDLPEARVTPSRPFLHSGVDFAGPIHILMSRSRGAKCDKAYICIFICMSTKAIHLELVGDMSAESFIAAFKRFVARRGKCSHIWSDKGTNFQGANKELKNLWHEANLDIPNQFVEMLAEDGTQWHFNPPYSPNFGGLWEAGVKSIKYHLNRILNGNLTFEEMSTTLCQIEACLNSRPLCPVDTNDPDNTDILTPGHFLIGEAPINVPEPNLLPLQLNRLSRWQHTQRLVQDFWHRWQNEYLTRLRQRPKWLRHQREFEIGEIVLLKEENLPPGKWALGRIVEKYPGRDAVCRVYSVKCRGKIVQRSVSKLCELPINNSDND